MKTKYIIILLFAWCLHTVEAQEVDSLIEVTNTDTLVLPVVTEKDHILFSKTKADSAYINGEYQKAIALYETLLEEGVSAELFYNLGNSYYKVDNLGKAILNYERALLLKPGNNDLQVNLSIVRSKTVDKVEPLPELFFITWSKSLMHQTSADGWAKWAISFFLLFLLSAFLYVFSKRILIKKLSFGFGILLFIFTLTTHQFARNQKKLLLNRNTAIIMTPSVTVRSTPSSSGTALFVLHEGRKVMIKDSMGQWNEIALEDGKVGWIDSANLEVI